MTYRTLPPMGGDQRAVAEVVRNIMDGKTNNTGEITLSAGGATTTTLNDERIGYGSAIIFTPLTVNAAGFVGSMYISARNKGSAVIAHPSNTLSDRKFSYVVVG